VSRTLESFIAATPAAGFEAEGVETLFARFVTFEGSLIGSTAESEAGIFAGPIATFAFEAPVGFDIPFGFEPPWGVEAPCGEEEPSENPISNRFRSSPGFDPVFDPVFDMAHPARQVNGLVEPPGKFVLD
jgi:hypothetical protein